MLRKTEENYLKNILEKRYYDKSCTDKEAAKIISILKSNQINTTELELHYENVFNSSFELIDFEFSLSESDINIIPDIKITISGKDEKLLVPAYKKLVERFCLHDELIKICRYIISNTYHSKDCNNGAEKYMIINVEYIKEKVQNILNKL